MLPFLYLICLSFSSVVLPWPFWPVFAHSPCPSYALSVFFLASSSSIPPSPPIFATLPVTSRSKQSVTFVNFLTKTNIWRFKDIRISKQFLHSYTLTNEYPNIFILLNLTQTNVWIYSSRKNWYEWMSEKIFVRNIFEYSNIFVTLWFKASLGQKSGLLLSSHPISSVPWWSCLDFPLLFGLLCLSSLPPQQQPSWNR